MQPRASSAFQPVVDEFLDGGSGAPWRAMLLSDLPTFACTPNLLNACCQNRANGNHKPQSFILYLVRR